jgi:hypothetical protein
MRKGQIVEINAGYRKSVLGYKYGVVSGLKFVGLGPIVEVTIPLENGMRLKAYLHSDALKPIAKEEVKL